VNVKNQALFFLIILQVINKETFFIWKWKDLHKLIGSYIIKNCINMNNFI